MLDAQSRSDARQGGPSRTMEGANGAVDRTARSFSDLEMQLHAQPQKASWARLLPTWPAWQRPTELSSTMRTLRDEPDTRARDRSEDSHADGHLDGTAAVSRIVRSSRVPAAVIRVLGPWGLPHPVPEHVGCGEGAGETSADSRAIFLQSRRGACRMPFSPRLTLPCRLRWFLAQAGIPRFGRLAQLVEQLTLNQRVTGSSPVSPISPSLCEACCRETLRSTRCPQQA